MGTPSRKHADIILTPLNPSFIIVKLEFAGVYVIFLTTVQKHECFELKMKNISLLSENFLFLEVKYSIYLNRHVFVMIRNAPNSTEFF